MCNGDDGAPKGVETATSVTSSRSWYSPDPPKIPMSAKLADATSRATPQPELFEPDPDPELPEPEPPDPDPDEPDPPDPEPDEPDPDEPDEPDPDEPDPDPPDPEPPDPDPDPEPDEPDPEPDEPDPDPDEPDPESLEPELLPEDESPLDLVESDLSRLAESVFEPEPRMSVL